MLLDQAHTVVMPVEREFLKIGKKINHPALVEKDQSRKNSCHENTRKSGVIVNKIKLAQKFSVTQ